MPPADRREHLRRRTAEAAALHRRAAQRLDARRGEPLEPGDLVLSTRTQDLPIEWLVLERSDTDPAWLVVAPVDTMALYGPTDAQLSRAETGGPVVARCGHPVRLASDRLNARHRTGRVDAESLALALARYREAADRLADRSLTDEQGGQPDYQDWVEDVLEPARDRLGAEDPETADAKQAPPERDTSKVASATPGPVAAPGPALDPPLPVRSDLLRRYQIAAAVLLAAGLGLAAGWFVEHRELERLTRREHPPTDHIPVAFLAGQGHLRGEAEALELPRDVRRFVLVVFLDPARLFASYRVEITAPSARQPIWSSDRVPRGNDAHLGLELQRQLLADGRYTLHLYGWLDGATASAEPAGELTFEIVSD